MSDLSEILTSDAVEAGVAAGSKKALFQHLAAAAERYTGIAARQISAALNRTAFYIGCHPYMSDDDVEHVLECFTRFFRGL